MPHVVGHKLKDAFTPTRGGVAGAVGDFKPAGLLDIGEAPDIPIKGIRGETDLSRAITPVPVKRPGIFQRAGGAIRGAFSGINLSDPKTGKFLSQLGAAINPKSQVSQVLGQLGTTIAEQRSETAFRERVEAGEEHSERVVGLIEASAGDRRGRWISEAMRGRESESLIKLREAQATQAGQVKVGKPFTADFNLNKDGSDAAP